MELPLTLMTDREKSVCLDAEFGMSDKLLGRMFETKHIDDI